MRMDPGINEASESIERTPLIDPEDVPFRRRLLLLISILIVTLSLCIMEWWSGFGIECQTDTVCDCYPRGVRCWVEQQFK